MYKSDATVKETQERAVPATTKKSTSWAVTVWTEWSKGRQEHFRNDPMEFPPHLMVCRKQEFDHWLSRFVVEAQSQQDGKPYPPNTLYQLCCGIMQYVRGKKPKINFFTDPDFDGFRRTLDGVMKKLQGKGVGVNRKQAEPILPEEEKQMWKTGVLGAHTPQSLLACVDCTLFCIVGRNIVTCNLDNSCWWNPVGVCHTLSTLKMCRKITQVGSSIEKSSQKR